MAVGGLARRSRAVCGTTGRADGDSRRRQRGSGQRSHGGGAWHDGGVHVAGKKAYLQYERELSEAIARLAQLREELKAAIDADAESYNEVMKAYKQAKTSSDGEASLKQP